MIKLNNQKGSLQIIMGITIAVIIMLFTIIKVLEPNESLNKAKLSRFQSDMKTIQTQLLTYVSTNGSLPSATKIDPNSSQLFTSDLLSTIVEKENGQIAVDFYKIDFKSLNINHSSIGNELLDPKDVIIVANYTYNIYYPLGFKINSKTYYTTESVTPYSPSIKSSYNTSNKINNNVNIYTSATTLNVTGIKELVNTSGSSIDFANFKKAYIVMNAQKSNASNTILYIGANYNSTNLRFENSGNAITPEYVKSINKIATPITMLKATVSDPSPYAYERYYFYELDSTSGVASFLTSIDTSSFNLY